MYSFDSRIRYSETDSEGRLTLMALLNYFQDCSTFQSEDAGVGVQYCKDRNVVWVLNAWQIVPIRLPKYGERVRIGTAPYDFQKFMGFRNFMMFDEDGELQLISSCDEGDLLYDDIGSELLIKNSFLSGACGPGPGHIALEHLATGFAAGLRIPRSCSCHRRNSP